MLCPSALTCHAILSNLEHTVTKCVYICMFTMQYSSILCMAVASTAGGQRQRHHHNHFIVHCNAQTTFSPSADMMVPGSKCPTLHFTDAFAHKTIINVQYYYDYCDYYYLLNLQCVVNDIYFIFKYKNRFVFDVVAVAAEMTGLNLNSH